jgi:hypothetical protein
MQSVFADNKPYTWTYQLRFTVTLQHMFHASYRVKVEKEILKTANRVLRAMPICHRSKKQRYRTVKQCLQNRSVAMLSQIHKFVLYLWNFLFDHESSPLRNIPDVSMRHYVLQILGFMWAVSFSLAIGSYTFLAYSLIGHTILIAAAAITVATWTAAKVKPEIFKGGSGRRHDGEHE